MKSFSLALYCLKFAFLLNGGMILKLLLPLFRKYFIYTYQPVLNIIKRLNNELSLSVCIISLSSNPSSTEFTILMFPPFLINGIKPFAKLTNAATEK